ncbi:MAG: universal stress protein [Desulfobulbus sp.]|jgi:nucleotide-binding universal stress UspA family protein|uniref:universal stress protein n=1 Tax=Desulfobulbus sp. TaxID=895 RepID=UPI0028509C3E|nr:universal stress protein [Desulfobulbus sp.]MDR2549983.1 universal stress protein [Desulfobulbus sp.]
MDQFSGTLLGRAKTLLLATDGSRFSEGAVQEAIFFGQACRAKVIVLHVVPTRTESIGAANFAVRQKRNDLAPHFDRIRVMADDSGVEIEIVVLGSSNPEKTLVEQARLRQADVILMGRRGKANRWSRLVGKTTTRAIAQGFPRILVVPKDCTLTGQHILVAVNDSPNSRQAALEALSLGSACPSLRQITVMAVARRKEDLTGAKRLADAVCAQALQVNLALACEPLVAEGDPANAVVTAARERAVDMILLGGPGRGGLAKMLTGHVTEHVIGRTPCAVLVVTAQDAADTPSSPLPDPTS